MGVSFKKSIRIGKNTRINLSKNGGIGFSTGIKGVRISKNAQGVRFSLGSKGIYYTKWFSKKKKEAKNKEKIKDENVKKINPQGVEEKVTINPEKDFERIPTNDEQLLLLYLGSKERNYLLYLLGFIFIGALAYFYFNQNTINLIVLLASFFLLGFYFQTKLNRYYFYFNRSVSLFNNEKYDKCYKYLKKCVTYRQKSRKALILFIFAAFKLEKYEETLNYVREFKNLEEPLEVMHFIEGCCCTELGLYKEGIEAIEKVYSDDDEMKFAKYKIIGDCHLGLGDYDRAISWFEELPVKSKEMNDDIMEYKYSLGKALYLKGDKKKALTHLNKVYDYRADYKDVKELIESN